MYVKNFLTDFVKNRSYRFLPASLKILDGSSGTVGKFMSRSYDELAKDGVIETNAEL
jgi:hypothetical protein